MSDINYEYIRGVGWIPADYSFAIGVCARGIRWRVEKRMPKRGEIWDATSNICITPQDYVDRWITVTSYVSEILAPAARDFDERDFDEHFPNTFTIVRVDE